MNRESVIEVLQQVALRSVQIDMHSENGNQFVPEALLNKWEKVYKPGISEFNEEFSESELKQMNCFTDYFLSRISGVPKEFNELIKDPYWLGVCKYASELLEDFERNG